MCKVYKRIGAVFCTFGIILMFVAGLMFNVSAADEESGSLKLICGHDNMSLAGTTWKIYKIGEKTSTGYTLTGDFTDYPVDLSKIMESTDTMTEAASTLSNFAVLDNLPPTTGGRANDSGVLTVRGLEKGLYLAVGSKLKIGNVSYFPTPFLVEIGGGSGMNVETYPKFIVKKTLPGETERFVLRKVWANATVVEDIPASLTIEIYEDDELFDTVELTAKDKWTYSWDGSADSEWRVKEANVPAGCFVMYRNNEVQFVIMNTYDNELLARVTTTVTPETTVHVDTVTTVVSSDYVPSTTTKDDGSVEQTMTRVSTTINTGVKPVTSVATTTVNSGDGGEETKTRVSTTIPEGQKPGESGSTGTVTTVSGETGTGTGTGTETYPTDKNGSTITTASTSKKDDTDKSTKSSKSSKSTKSTRTTKTTTTTIEKLPQTGQLWWPVPVMLFGGLIFVAVGLRLLLDNRKED